jgi:hypothetical protein
MVFAVFGFCKQAFAQVCAFPSPFSAYLSTIDARFSLHLPLKGSRPALLFGANNLLTNK